MKLNKNMLLLGVLSAMLLPSVLALSGCSGDGMVKEDPTLTKTRVDSAAAMRSYFDKAKGNYDALSPEDKVALAKLTGSEAHSREAFGHMVYTGK
ncbi:MAG: hypothetical protein P4L46_10485 [Fimbriimonas sp.]|nr:hypothetical protein [Fimbriimonas sp.]